jgi:hypothetical protein
MTMIHMVQVHQGDILVFAVLNLLLFSSERQGCQVI